MTRRARSWKTRRPIAKVVQARQALRRVSRYCSRARPSDLCEALKRAEIGARRARVVPSDGKRRGQQSSCREATSALRRRERRERRSNGRELQSRRATAAAATELSAAFRRGLSIETRLRQSLGSESLGDISKTVTCRERRSRLSGRFRRSPLIRTLQGACRGHAKALADCADCAHFAPSGVELCRSLAQQRS